MIASKKIKYLLINTNKEREDLHNENFKSLKQVIENDTRKCRHPTLMDY